MGRAETAFPPVVGDMPRVLILGSMPGVASLEAQEYYAHPRNAFWPVMASLGLPVLDAGSERLPYAQRLRALMQHGVALWDVVHRCERPGSLDSAIIKGSVEANDFQGLFQQHPSLQVVAFNGATAETLFRRHVRLPDNHGLVLMRLPSTSPAHAALPVDGKIQAWSVLRPYVPA